MSGAEARVPLVLVADDSASVRAVVRAQLEAQGSSVVEAADGVEALRCAREQSPDVVLLDIEMPRLDGRQVLAEMRRDSGLRDIPVVFLTSLTQLEEVVQALTLGAHDYLRKPFEPAELLARVNAAIRTKLLQDQLRERNADLDRLARIDAMTGLYNRRHLQEHLRALIGASQRRQEPAAALMVDIDLFKGVNDTRGHAAGDAVICEVARRLQGRLRPQDMVGRWGGEEFLLLLADTTGPAATILAERLRTRIAAAPVGGAAGGDIRVTVSIGCASGMYTDGEALVRDADDALYEAKRAGRNTVRLGPPAQRVHSGDSIPRHGG